MKSIRETLDQLDEITRRDLLKGAGAAALAGAGAMGYEKYDQRGLWLPSLDKEDIHQVRILVALYIVTKNFAEVDPNIAYYRDAKVKFQKVKKVVNTFLSENPGMKQVFNDYYKDQYWLNAWKDNGYDNTYLYTNADSLLNDFAKWYQNKKENPNKDEFREDQIEEASPDALATIDKLTQK